MPERHWKVGELAARTGLTVRALHHYDAIGLRTHRLYTSADVTRLHQIICLKQLGFGLEQIFRCGWCRTAPDCAKRYRFTIPSSRIMCPGMRNKIGSAKPTGAPARSRSR